MRLLSTILAIWIASMSVLPCMDGDGLQTFSEEVHLHASESDEHDGEDSHNDLCSPFCVCNCCHSHIVLLTLESTLAPMWVIQQKRGYSESIAQTKHFGIFRPPRQA